MNGDHLIPSLLYLTTGYYDRYVRREHTNGYDSRFEHERDNNSNNCFNNPAWDRPYPVEKHCRHFEPDIPRNPRILNNEQFRRRDEVLSNLRNHPSGRAPTERPRHCESRVYMPPAQTFPTVRRSEQHIIKNREIRKHQRGERYFGRERKHQTCRITHRNPSDSKRKSPLGDFRTEKDGQKGKCGPSSIRRIVHTTVSKKKDECIEDHKSKISDNKIIPEESKQIKEPCSDYSIVSMDLDTDDEEAKSKDSQRLGSQTEQNNNEGEVQTNITKDKYKKNDINNTVIKTTETTTNNTKSDKNDIEKHIARKNIYQADASAQKLPYTQTSVLDNTEIKHQKKSIPNEKDAEILKFDNCKRKGENLVSDANTRKIPKIGNNLQKSEASNPQNSTHNIGANQPIKKRDPRLLKINLAEDKNIAGRVLQASSSSSPSKTRILICDNKLVDPRINHKGYNKLKVHPIELKIPEFRKQTEKLKMKHKNLRDYRHIRKPTRISIRNRSSVCSGNINAIRKYYKKPIAELMKFCCHVSIRRNECKNILLRKSADISISLIDTRKSYLVHNNSIKEVLHNQRKDEKDSNINRCHLKKKNEETATSSVDISSINTKKSYIVSKFSENKIPQADETKKDSEKKSTNDNVHSERIKLKENNHPQLEVKTPLADKKKKDSSRDNSKNKKLSTTDYKEVIDTGPKDVPSNTSNEKILSSMPLLDDVQNHPKLSSAVTTNEVLKQNEPTDQSKETPKDSQSPVDERNEDYKMDIASNSNKLLCDSKNQVPKKDPNIVLEKIKKAERALKREIAEDPFNNKKMKADTPSVKFTENIIPNSAISTDSTVIDEPQSAQKYQNNTSVIKNTSTLVDLPIPEKPKIQENCENIKVPSDENDKGNICNNETDRSEKLNLKRNSETDAETLLDELFKSIEPSSPTSCENIDNVTPITNSVDCDEYLLHIPEDTKRNPTSDTDMSSDELLKSLEETIESMTSADIPLSSEDAEKYFQTEELEKELTDRKQSKSMVIEDNVPHLPVDNSETKSSSDVIENIQGLSEKHVEKSKAENIVTETINCGSSSSSSSNTQRDRPVKEVTMNEEDQCMQEDDADELLLKIRVIKNPHIKKEQEEESLMNLKVDLFGVTPEIKIEDPESTSKQISKLDPIPTSTSDQVSDENRRPDEIERRSQEGLSEFNGKHIPSEPSKNLLDLKEKRNDSLLHIIGSNGIDNQRTISENTESPSDNLVDMKHSKGNQCVKSNEVHETLTRNLLLPSSKSQVGCSSPSQTQKLPTVRNQNINNTNITGEIGRTVSIGNTQLTASYLSKSDVSAQQVTKYTNTSVPISKTTCTSTDITLTSLLQTNSTSSSNKSKEQGKYSANVSRNLSSTFSNENTSSVERERRMPQMLNIASKSPVEQGNGATYSLSGFETHLAINAYKIVNAYVLSKCRGRYLAGCLEFLNHFCSTENETNNVKDAILKMTDIFAECLLQNMRNIPVTMRDPVYFVSYFMESLVQAAKNEKARPSLSLYIGELVEARKNEYDKSLILKYFKSYIENDVQTLKHISATPMTSEQYVRLKSQIFFYLQLERSSKFNSPAYRQNANKHVTGQSIPNRPNYTQRGTNSPLESAVAMNHRGSTQPPTMISTVASITAPQCTSLLRSKNVSQQQNYRPTGNPTITPPNVQNLPANLSGNRKRLIEVPNAQQHLSNPSCKPPPAYNETWHMPIKKPNNVVSWPSNVVSNAVCTYPNCYVTQQSRSPAYMSSMGLTATHPIISSRINQNNLPNQNFGVEVNRANISAAAQVPSSRIAPNNLFNQTFGNELNGRVIPSGVVAPVVSSRMTAGNFSNSTTASSASNPTTSRNIMQSEMSASMRNSTTAPFVARQNQIYGGFSENTAPASETRTTILKRALNNTQNTETVVVVNTSENVGYFNTRQNGHSTPEAVAPATSTNLLGYFGGSKVEIASSISATPKSTTEVAVQGTRQNEKEVLKTPRNENLPLKTVVPIPSSILTPNTPEQLLGPSGIEKEYNETRLAATPPRQPIPYPTPPISNGNVASENIEETQISNPSEDWISSNENKCTVASHEDLKPSIAALTCDLTHSINLKSEPEDIIDLTWVEDDEVKLEPSNDGYTLTLDEAPESLLILHNRKCLCGEDAIYLCACNKVMYCSQECQFKDWENHQRVCPAGVMP